MLFLEAHSFLVFTIDDPLGTDHICGSSFELGVAGVLVTSAIAGGTMKSEYIDVHCAIVEYGFNDFLHYLPVATC